MNYLKKNTELLLLLLLLAMAGALRFYNFSGWSLSNDELSALTRRNFGSFSQLINEGVRPDFHPAGVQVFLYYWVKVFGDSEAALRFPFVICGALSVLLVYLIGKKWFSASAGLLAATTLAFLQFPILYSQLARPYSPGLLFCLVNVYFWTLLLFEFKKYKPVTLVAGYAISAALCMYTHYFSFLFAIIAGLTGLFLLNRDNRKYYLGSGLIAVLLFLPHLKISIVQFSRGGVGSWLGKPEENYFLKFLSHSFNDSFFVQGMIAIIFVASVFLFAKELRSGNKLRVIALAWFFAPFLIGYYYSLYRNPVLQYSILLFSFPFLLIFLFSFFSDHRKYFTLACFLVLAVSGAWSTVVEKKFYSTSFFGTFKELAGSGIEWDKKFGKENVTTVINCIDYNYINYYFKKNDYKSDFIFLRGDDVSAVGNFQQLINKVKTKYFVYGWSNTHSPYAFYELIKERYPKIVEEKIYFNSRITLFETGTGVREPVVKYRYDFETPDPPFANYDSTEFISGKMSWKMDSLQEYSAYPMQFKVGDLFRDSIKFLNIQAWVFSISDISVHLVIEFSSKDSVYEWQSAPSDRFSFEPGQWCRLFYTQKLPASTKPEDTVKIYIWNPNKNSLYLDDVRIYSYRDMDYDY